MNRLYYKHAGISIKSDMHKLINDISNSVYTRTKGMKYQSAIRLLSTRDYIKNYLSDYE